MIDDATIDNILVDSDTPYEFARAIEQLARQEQREEYAAFCEVIGNDWRADGETKKFYAAEYLADAIRASGKENSNEG